MYVLKSLRISEATGIRATGILTVKFIVLNTSLFFPGWRVFLWKTAGHTCFLLSKHTPHPPEFNSSPLKNGGTGRRSILTFLFGPPATFLGGANSLLNFRKGKIAFRADGPWRAFFFVPGRSLGSCIPVASPHVCS